MTRKVGNTMPSTYDGGLASLAAASAAVIVRALGGSVAPFLIGLFWASFGAALTLPWVIRQPGVFPSAYPLRHHALRAGLKLLALICLFVAFSQGQGTGLTAFASLIFVLVGVSTMLGECLTLPLVLASFAGALMMIDPDGGAPSVCMGFALVGAVLAPVIQLMLTSRSGGAGTDTPAAWSPT